MKQTYDASVDQRVRNVILRVFRLSPEEANGDLRMGTSPQWDSMGHVQLIVALEDEFDMTFPTYEIAQLSSVAAIVHAINMNGAK